MRFLPFLLLFACLYSSCSTRLIINEKRIHQNSRIEGLSIYKISVTSFGEEGKPTHYEIDSAYHCSNLSTWEYADWRPFVPKKIKKNYDSLLHLYDSLQLYGPTAYREIDTIKIYSTRYIPAGVKKPLPFYEAATRLDALMSSQIGHRERKTIRFTRPNRSYHWTVEKYKESNKKQRIASVRFTPDAWYYIPIDCSLGLLTAGTCHYFFYVNEKGKPVNVYREEHERGGPF